MIVSNYDHDICPCYSPDGNFIAYAASYGNDNFEIAIMNLQTNQVTRVTDSAGADLDPCWK